jgi:hypothetical protein
MTKDRKSTGPGADRITRKRFLVELGYGDVRAAQRPTMDRRVRQGTVAGLLVMLAIATTAHADVVTPPGFEPPEFAKGGFFRPKLVSVEILWAPATFAPLTGRDHHEFRLHNDPAGFLVAASGGDRTFSSFITVLSEGHLHTATITACSSEPPCPPPSLVMGSFRPDGTAPTGVMSINDGAAFTNRRAVTLDLLAQDPDPDGSASGLPSGVSQVAVDLEATAATRAPRSSSPRTRRRTPAAAPAPSRHRCRWRFQAPRTDPTRSE